MTLTNKALQVLGEAANSGRFVSIDFLKKDGSFRTMVAKVPKNGADRYYAGLVVVFDVNKGAYRSFRVENLLSIVSNGNETICF